MSKGYSYTIKCGYCGAVVETNRKEQRFCYPPKKCRQLWWADERKRKTKITNMVIQHDKDIRLIKDKLGIK